MINTLVFEDNRVSDLAPITTSRPAYAITCATYRLIDLIEPIAGPTVGLVRPFLQAIQDNDFDSIASELNETLEWTLVVNARLVPTISNLTLLESLVEQASNGLASTKLLTGSDNVVAAAVVPTKLLIGQTSEQQLARIIGLKNDDDADGQAKPTDNEESSSEPNLFQYPHDVIRENLAAFKENLAYRIRLGHYQESTFGVYLGNHCSVPENTVFDSSSGPIVIDDNVSIGPFSFFRGPVYVGPNSKISEHASVKDEVSIGHTCKIGGEIEGTIIEAYSNKQHHGFLGHAYLGSWINLGAGTCNSDLKNTYGTVNMTYGDKKISTGSQFIGCVMGDYSKTAINTSIFTGKTIGVASMVYGFATTNVPSFVNYARVFGQIGEIPPAVIASTQKRMFDRRGRDQRACDIQLINDMFQMTESERPAALSPVPIEL
jgi:glucose-1-phosphate thymidylyltransferase